MNTTPFGFTGEPYDSNGLLHLRARYYDAQIARFFQFDPSWQEANLYAYSGNSPIVNTDPTGNNYCRNSALLVLYLSGMSYYNNSLIDLIDPGYNDPCSGPGAENTTAALGLCQEIKDLNKKLEAYGVTVNFEKDVNGYDLIMLVNQAYALLITSGTVRTMAGRVASVFNGGITTGGEAVTERQAFQHIFGPTRLDIVAQPMYHDDLTPYYGYNPTRTTNGVNVITLYVGGFRDAGDERSGPTWVAHELAHNLELDYGQASFEAPGLVAHPIRDLIGPQSGAWSSSTGELTPDIIAAWAFDDHNYDKYPDLATAFRAHINTWMSEVILRAS